METTLLLLGKSQNPKDPNRAHKYTLVEAERARVKRKYKKPQLSTTKPSRAPWSNGSSRTLCWHASSPLISIYRNRIRTP